mmetsp:Transcript_1245/g.1913  ORF Transcript_1245/g.1913 Transcript_1245/m.1913 type:complete len:151 (+) Transcript_1245:1020-1472(+)
MNKYFTQSDSSSAATPKLILLSADDAFLSNVLGLFNNLFLARPEPGAYVAVDFYECQWNCYWYDRFKVEVVYCPDGNNLANTCTILNLTDGFRTTVEVPAPPTSRAGSTRAWPHRLARTATLPRRLRTCAPLPTPPLATSTAPAASTQIF